MIIKPLVPDCISVAVNISPPVIPPIIVITPNVRPVKNPPSGPTKIPLITIGIRTIEKLTVPSVIELAKSCNTAVIAMKIAVTTKL